MVHWQSPTSKCLKIIHLFAGNFYQVEAEEQPEISEAYGVTAVPYFVFCKVGKRLLFYSCFLSYCYFSFAQCFLLELCSLSSLRMNNWMDIFYRQWWCRVKYIFHDEWQFCKDPQNWSFHDSFNNGLHQFSIFDEWFAILSAKRKL
jgi:hypothetical protein